ncbi:unnamed protein product [Eruca vesicaria subsp. sativa]|uniref:FAF domain-containing protein n=1 Tax=Eruca vesicaria subsp. sativa TaxID=29727 RepID=A0ABC8IN69_ERUVS|nr:unnamed protein product [Eruca vesicaria subsp. sativa]
MSVVICQAQEKIVNENGRNQSFTQKGGLSFLQSMSDITAIVRNVEDKAYVHPSEKRSVSKLSEKSLEMCTESLGAETGSESGDELSLLAFEATNITPRVPSHPQEQEKDTDFPPKKSTIKSFPPPIKFVKGSKYSRVVRSLGEDGRVVVQAITVSSQPPNFVAERGEGRLRLCLSPESSLVGHDHEEEEEEEETGENLEGKNGNKNFSRLSSRCKENGREPKSMLTWKQQQFWVAT